MCLSINDKERRNGSPFLHRDYAIARPIGPSAAINDAINGLHFGRGRDKRRDERKEKQIKTSVAMTFSLLFFVLFFFYVKYHNRDKSKYCR